MLRGRVIRVPMAAGPRVMYPNLDLGLDLNLI